MDRPSIILLVGRPASGKTTALKAIIHLIVKMKKTAFGRFHVSTKFSGDFDFAPQGFVRGLHTRPHRETCITNKSLKRKNPKKTFPQNILVIDDALDQIVWYSRSRSNFISTCLY